MVSILIGGFAGMSPLDGDAVEGVEVLTEFQQLADMLESLLKM